MHKYISNATELQKFLTGSARNPLKSSLHNYWHERFSKRQPQITQVKKSMGKWRGMDRTILRRSWWLVKVQSC